VSDAARAAAPDVPVRDAATMILLRDRARDPRILVGQRGAGAVFMPSKFVFPGGALDAQDSAMRLAVPMGEACMARLRAMADPGLAEPLVLAGIREVWEETGLVLGAPAAGVAQAEVPADWQGFVAGGVAPSAAGMQFIFRAVTPPGRPRRFDARFFLVEAESILGDPDDFTHASSELSHLHWAPLAEVRALDLPFITEVVLAEVSELVESGGPPESVPFFHHEDGRSWFDRL